MTLGTQAKHLNHYTPASWFLSKTTYTDNSNLFQLSKVFQLQCFTLFQLWKINWKIQNTITSAQFQHNHGKLLDLYWRYLNPKSKNIQTGASCAKLVVGLCYILIILQGCGNTVMLCFSSGKLSEKSYLSGRNPTCPVFSTFDTWKHSCECQCGLFIKILASWSVTELSVHNRNKSNWHDMVYYIIA
jgi:hypothetical protein